MDESNPAVAKRQLGRLLGGATCAIYVLSGEDTLVFANEALAGLLGRPLESLLGLRCDSSFSLAPNEDTEIASLLSPPVGWSRRSIKTVPFDLETQAGSPLVRCLVPLDSSENGDILCIIGQRAASDKSPFCDDRLGHVQEILRKTRTSYAQGTFLWFLQGRSNATRRALEQVQIASHSGCGVWIDGPTGAGQSWVAQAIHIESQRIATTTEGTTPLTRIECRLMDREILSGMFELILESQKTSQRTQGVLFEGLESLAGDCLLSVASFIRQHPRLRYFVTVSTDQLAPGMVENKDWKEIRSIVGVLQLDLPPLTDRLDDLLVLVSSWLHQIENKRGRSIETTEAFIDLLTAYPWPEDIEEFSRTLESAVASLGDGQLLDVAHLPVNVRTCVSHAERAEATQPVDLDSILEDVEKTMILRALEISPSNKTAAAKLLNISRARLQRRLQQWGMLTDSESPDRDDDMPIFQEVD